jgi:hypothetical protein
MFAVIGTDSPGVGKQLNCICSASCSTDTVSGAPATSGANPVIGGAPRTTLTRLSVLFVMLH